MGQFTANYLDENGRRIPIISQLSINGSVQLLGIPAFVRNSGLLFIENLQAPTVPSGWGDADTSNKNWGVIPGLSYSIWSVTWDSTVPAHPDYMPRIPENPRTAARRVRDDFCLQRRRDIMWRRSKSRNTIVNPRIHRSDDDREGLVTQ